MAGKEKSTCKICGQRITKEPRTGSWYTGNGFGTAAYNCRGNNAHVPK